MYIARILYPVEVLGAGKRIGIWFAGCPHRCRECSNPELWEKNQRYSVTCENVTELIRKIAHENHVDGFTITGGEPFYQPSALNALTESLSCISDDILIYTGYTIEELVSFGSCDIEKVLERISVLIDGRYIPELNKNYTLRGSGNQRIHILNEKYRDLYNKYLESENKIQNFTIGNSIVSVGIHKRNFKF